MRLGVCLLVLLAACTPYYHGQRAEYAGHWDQAAAAYGQEVERHPEAIRPRLALGRAQFMHGNYPTAQATFQDILQRQPDTWQATFYLGLMDVAQGQRKAGLAKMRQVRAPAQPRLTDELRCSVDHVARQELDDAATVERILVYLKECQRRQEFRDSPHGDSFSGDLDRDIPVECPPMLDRVMYLF